MKKIVIQPDGIQSLIKWGVGPYRKAEGSPFYKMTDEQLAVFAFEQSDDLQNWLETNFLGEIVDYVEEAYLNFYEGEVDTSRFHFPEPNTANVHIAIPAILGDGYDVIQEDVSEYVEEDYKLTEGEAITHVLYNGEKVVTIDTVGEYRITLSNKLINHNTKDCFSVIGFAEHFHIPLSYEDCLDQEIA